MENSCGTIVTQQSPNNTTSKVFVLESVLPTQQQDRIKLSFSKLVDLSIQFWPLLLPSITLPTPFTRANPFQGPSNTSSPRKLKM